MKDKKEKITIVVPSCMARPEGAIVDTGKFFHSFFEDAKGFENMFFTATYFKRDEPKIIVDKKSKTITTVNKINMKETTKDTLTIIIGFFIFTSVLIGFVYIMRWGTEREKQIKSEQESTFFECIDIGNKLQWCYKQFIK